MAKDYSFNSVLRQAKTQGTAQAKTPLQILAIVQALIEPLAGDPDWRHVIATNAAGKGVTWAADGKMSRTAYKALIEEAMEYVEGCATPADPPLPRPRSRMRVCFDKASI